MRAVLPLDLSLWPSTRMRTAPVRRLLIGSTRPRRWGCERVGDIGSPDWRPVADLARRARGVGGPVGPPGPDREGPGRNRQPTSASEPRPCPGTSPRTTWLVYAEFAGLDAHAATWNKTAAYRLLTETPLGVMLEAVAGQLLDKALSYVPNNKVTGPECVTLIKHVARSGWAGRLARHPQGGRLRAHRLNSTPPWSFGALRARRSGPFRPGPVMADGIHGVKPRIEHKDDRPMVVVARPASQARMAGPSWAWWAEKERPGHQHDLPGGCRRGPRRAGRQDPQRDRSPDRQGALQARSRFRPGLHRLPRYRQLPQDFAG